MNNKKNYYVVRKGKKPGIYTTWDEAKKQVLGFPGAIYKKIDNDEEALEYLNGNKDLSNKVGKVYVVANGKNPGIYSNWEDASEQIQGFQNAVYKSFNSDLEAKEYFESYKMNNLEKYYLFLDGKNTKIYFSKTDIPSELSNEKILPYKTLHEAIKKIKNSISDENARNEVLNKYAISFTDGSFNKSNKTYSSGAVIFSSNKIVKINQRYGEKKIAELQNVAGELMAVINVIKYCLRNNILGIEIHHDYQGVARFTLGEWSAKDPFIKEYVDFMNIAKKNVNISFIWVKGHSGNIYNDMADKLANDAVFEYNESEEII